MQHKQSSGAPVPPSVRCKPGKGSANTQEKTFPAAPRVSLCCGISQPTRGRRTFGEAELWKQTAQPRKGNGSVFSPSSARLRKEKKKKYIPVVFCAAAHLELQSFLLLHSAAPVLGRNPAGLGLVKGAASFGVPRAAPKLLCPEL